MESKKTKFTFDQASWFCHPAYVGIFHHRGIWSSPWAAGTLASRRAHGALPQLRPAPMDPPRCAPVRPARGRGSVVRGYSAPVSPLHTASGSPAGVTCRFTLPVAVQMASLELINLPQLQLLRRGIAASCVLSSWKDETPLGRAGSGSTLTAPPPRGTRGSVPRFP